ncbi:MAG TPA: DUF1343 domain-containing protein [Vicinamibacterales bacterium]|jgi:uncharacterized protein YbbC (DUF1343 family)|nr:DUF1343 domain-containing protein [Vicinamibacterales bacterium]
MTPSAPSLAGPAIIPGIARLLGPDRGLVAGTTVGLVCNPASIDEGFRHSADLLFEDPEIRLGAIFGPQHGFRSDLQDNMIESPHAEDARRRVPIYSLYSETREPTAGMLQGIDALVIDLQDVGTRVYTYIYTMANCMRAAARHGVKVVVCDRPNPIGGDEVEGPTLREPWTSFVGQFPIPLRHGMTIAELARLFNEAFGLGAALEVVPLEGWRRSMYHDETGLPWVITSPNIPTLDTAIVYPGAVLFEGTTLSEGRGTTRPFELIGAPWIDGDRLAAALNRRGLPGVHFRPVFFEPTFQKHARQTCGGCQLHVTDRRAFEPVRTAVELIAEFRRQDPSRFAWREPPYEYEHDKQPIDILYGSDRLRATIDSGLDLAPLFAVWESDEEAFRARRREYLLY